MDERRAKIKKWRESGKSFGWIAQQLGVSRPLVSYLYYSTEGAKVTADIRRDTFRGEEQSQVLADYVRFASSQRQLLLDDRTRFLSEPVVKAVPWARERAYDKAVVDRIELGTRSTSISQAGTEARQAYLAWKRTAMEHPMLPGAWLEEQAEWANSGTTVLIRDRRKLDLVCAPSKAGTLFRKYLDDNGISVNEIARRVGTRACYVSQWMSGFSPIPQLVYIQLGLEVPS